LESEGLAAVKASPAASLRLNGVALSYASSSKRPVRVIDDFSLAVDPGEIVALLGASGCGKTTILKLIAGLLRPDAGVITVDGVTINETPAEQRRTAMVFQKPLLFPHLSIGENVAFSLKLKNFAAPEIQERVREALAMVKLDGFETRRPNQLSGGQEQRVSIARALVSEPRILLLDEPFTALDENLRIEIRSLVRRIQRQLQVTTVFVTHDKNEAAAVAHRIAFLQEGRILQSGTLRQFYESPASAETARFFGFRVLRGRIESGQLTSGLGVTPCNDAAGPVWACIRPDLVRITAEEGAATIVESSVDLGDRISTSMRFNSEESIELIHSPPEFAVGQAVRVSLDPATIRTFPRSE
jgi:putative spermidine/putrescine transport system ATP-binding protein